MRGRPQAWPRRQGGVAIVLALLLVALAVTLVCGMFWPQQVQLRALENQQWRMQSRWLLRSALELARQTLRQDDLSSGLTTLDGAWALPQAVAAYGDFPGPGLGPAGDAAVLGIRMIDAQSRYNLANLAGPVGGAIDARQVMVYDRLLRLLHLDPGLASGTARALSHGAGGNALPLRRLEDLLALPGYTPQVLAALAGYAVLLPEATALNANTAPAEVLAAVLDLPLGEAVALTASRGRAWLRDTADLSNRLHGRPVVADMGLDVRSDYFLVTSSVRWRHGSLEQQALIRRRLGGTAPVVLDLSADSNTRPTIHTQGD